MRRSAKEFMEQYEQRPLSEEEWGKLLRACKHGDTLKAIRALHAGKGVVRQGEVSDIKLIVIQACLNSKFQKEEPMPYWVAFQYDSRAYDHYGRKTVRVNARVVLMCLKPTTSASVPQTAA